jgi:hypothetical protein
MKTIISIIASFLMVIAIKNSAISQCAFGGAQYPSTTFSNPGSTFVTVSGCIYGGEYQLYNVVAGTTYEWSYCTGDGAASAAGEDLQLTLFNNATGVSLAYADDICGVAPKISWTATFTGTVRVLTNLYNCISNTTCHTLVWRGVAASAAGCNSGVPYITYTVTCPSTQVSYAPCTYAGEYNTLTLTAGTAYTFGSSVTTDYITITDAANTILASGTQPVNFTPTTSGTYRVYIHLNSACGTSNTCRNPWVTCGTTTPPTVGCNTGVFYSSYTPTCIGTQETYAACTFAGEYNNLTLNAGTSYTFGSSVTTDYITITNAANTILTSGTQPISFTPPTSGTYRVYIHLNSACGTANACRNPWIQCGTVPPSIPNDPCSGAIAITPGTYSGTTVGATADLAPACGTAADGTGGGVWYTVTGTSPCKSFTVSTCTGTTFDSQIRVFSGSCGTLTCVGGSDDFCGAQSQVTWNYTPGTTYYVLVHGFGANTGPFSLTLSESSSSTITPTLATLPIISGECSVNLSGAPTATSSCNGAITATTTGSTSFSAQGTYTVTWNYSDAAGTTLSQTQTVIVDDITAPVPALASLADINSSCAVTSLSAPIASDNCAGGITGTHNATFPIVSNTLVTWTYDDGNGNSSTQTQQVNVSDLIPPVPTLASLSTVSSVCSPIVSLTAPSASDNCSGLITGTTTTSFPIASNTTVTWTFTDAAGNTTTQTQTVEVGDVIAPVPTNSSLPTITSTCSPVTSITAPTAFDNCSGAILGTTTSSFPITANSTITWTFTDAAGNTTTQTQTVEVGDNSAPVANVSSLSPVVSTCPVPSISAPTATDNCSGQITGTTTAVFPISANTTITWSFVDATGNTSTQTQAVTINDNQAPVPTSASLPTVTSTCSPVTSITAPTSLDNCSGSIVGTTTTSFPITSNTTVTWTFTDGFGNISTQTQVVEVEDVIAPVPTNASLPTVTSTCSPVTSIPAPTANDNCSGSIIGTTTSSFPITSNTTVTWTFTDAAGNTTTQNQLVEIGDVIAPVPTNASLPTITSICSPVTSIAAPTAIDNCSGSIIGTTTSSFPITSNTTVTWTFTDATGNTTTQNQLVEVGDNSAPVADVSNLSPVVSTCSVPSISAPTATDNCSGQITGTTSAVFPISATTAITWTYTDAIGNTSTQEQLVTINDNQAPVPTLSNLSDIISTCNPVSTLNAPTANDNCSGLITGTTTTVLPITSSTTITWTYVDGFGNQSTQTQVVNIGDLTAPVPDVSTLPDVTGTCSINSLNPPTATDNCSGAVIATTNSVLPITSNSTITWTYSDATGNTITQTQNVILVDNIAPVALNASLSDVIGVCEINNLTAPTANDNCAGIISGTTSTALPITSNTTITWTFNDGNGNTSTQTQNIILNDNVAPTPDINVLADVSSSCSISSLTAPTATDNCDGVLLGTSNAIFPITSNTTVTWTYTDGNGNTTTQNQNVIITDSGAPIPDATLNDINAICEVSSLTAPTATDACQGSITGVSNATFPMTTSTLVTWTFTDNFNNVSTQTQQVNISTLQADIVLNGATLEVVNPISNATYQWVDCDNNNAPIVGAASSTYTPTISGNYAVIVSYLSCSTTSSCSAVQVNGLENITWKFLVYPNPTNDMVHVTVPENGSLSLYDVSGKLIWKKDISEGKNTIDFRNMATGSYVIEFTSTNYISNTRIVVEK